MTIRHEFYILKGKKVIPASFNEWDDGRKTIVRVARTETPNGDISTVFLGMNHQWGAGPPLVFETMIFGGTHANETWRCSTWEQAEDQHVLAIEFAST